MTRLHELLTEAKGKASIVEHRVSEMATEVVKAYQKGEVFQKELLKSNQDAYAKGMRWHRNKVAKHYPSVDLNILSIESSTGSEPSGFNANESGKATSLAS